jgi:hypothetical protein
MALPVEKEYQTVPAPLRPCLESTMLLPNANDTFLSVFRTSNRSYSLVGIDLDSSLAEIAGKQLGWIGILFLSFRLSPAAGPEFQPMGISTRCLCALYWFIFRILDWTHYDSKSETSQ